MNSSAAFKIKMMKASVRCLIFGLLGMLPVLGIPFALAALHVAGRVRGMERDCWNPAKPHRLLGTVCAGAGLIVWLTVGGLLALRAVSQP